MYRRILFVFILVVILVCKGYAQPAINPTASSACYGSNSGTLTLTGSYTPVRWEMSVTGDVPWIGIVNQTPTLNYVNLNETTWFRIVVKSGSGAELYSAPAVVTVSSKVGGGTITGTGGLVCKGLNNSELTLSGHTGSVVKWESSSDNIFWTEVPGSAGVTNHAFSDVDRKTWYRAVVQSGAGCASVASAPYPLEISEATLAGNLSGSNTVCQIANSGVVTLTGNRGNVLRWESSVTGSAPWSTIAETKRDLEYTNLLNTTFYRAVVKNGACAEEVTPVAAIHVDVPSVGGTTTGATGICTGDNSGEMVLVGHKGNVVMWQYSLDNGSSWVDTAVIHPALTYSHLTQTRLYRAEIKNGSCDPVASAPAKITVYPLPVVSFTASPKPQGTPVVFVNQSTISSGLLKQFVWDFSDGTGSNARNPVHPYENGGVYPVKLEITSDKGCVDSLTQNLVIYEVPKVNFSFAHVCLKNVAHFINTSVVADPSPTYSWDFGDGSPLSSEINPEHQYATPGIYQVTLTVSTPGSVAAKTQSIRVYPQALPAFEAAEVCMGSNTLFLNRSTINSGYLTYAWDFGDGLSSTDLNPSHLYANAGSFNVRLVTWSNEGCSDTLFKEVTVHPMPVAKFSFTDVPFGNPVQYTHLSTISAGELKPSWNFGDGNTSLHENPEHTYAAAGNYLVTVSVTSASGCVATQSQIAWVYPKPHAAFIASSVCAYDSVKFENQSTLSSGSMTFHWAFGDGSTSEQRNPVKKYDAPGTYQVTLIATSDKDGADTVIKAIDVYPIPVADFSGSDVCDGFTTLFEDQSSVVSGSITNYLWDFGDGSNAVRQSPSRQYLNPGVYQVTLRIGTDKSCQASVSKVVTVFDNPLANFNVSGVCLNQAVLPINLSEAGIDATYEWEMGDGTIYQVFTPSHTYAGSGLYPVNLKVTDLNGCIDSLKRNVIIYALPVVDAGADTTIVLGFPVRLNAGGGVVSEWYPAEGLSSPFVSNPVASPTITTTYQLTVQDQYGCINRDSVTVSVEDHHRLIATNIITPDGNGKNDTWFVQNIENYPDAEVTIFNRWGTIVYRSKGYRNNWNGTNTKRDVLPDGAYYYIITMHGSETIYKGTVTIMRNK